MKILKLFGYGSLILLISNLISVIFIYLLLGKWGSSLKTPSFIINLLITIFYLVSFMGIFYLSIKLKKKALMIVSPLFMVLFLLIGKPAYVHMINAHAYLILYLLFLAIFLLVGILFLFIKNIKFTKLTGIILIISSLIAIISSISVSFFFLMNIKIIFDILFALFISLLFFSLSRETENLNLIRN